MGIRLGGWLLKDVALGALRVAVPGAGAAIDLIGQLAARAEAEQSSREQLEHIDRAVRSAVAEQVRSSLGVLGTTSLHADALTEELRKLNDLRQRGWAPHLVEGCLVHSSHWEALHRNPENYGVLLADGDRLHPGKVHVVVGLERPRIVALAPFTLHALLAAQAAGAPPVELVGQRGDIWAVRGGLAVPAPPPPARVDLALGASGTAVRTLQANLAARGHECGDDGRFGPLVLRAVMNFQRSVGIDPDGIVGPRTRAALGAENPRTSSPAPSSAPPPIPSRSAGEPEWGRLHFAGGSTSLRGASTPAPEGIGGLDFLVRSAPYGAILERAPGARPLHLRRWSGPDAPTGGTWRLGTEQRFVPIETGFWVEGPAGILEARTLQRLRLPPSATPAARGEIVRRVARAARTTEARFAGSDLRPRFVPAWESDTGVVVTWHRPGGFPRLAAPRGLVLDERFVLYWDELGQAGPVWLKAAVSDLTVSVLTTERAVRIGATAWPPGSAGSLAVDGPDGLEVAVLLQLYGARVTVW